MKRFTETNKWDDPWFIRLSAVQKLLWLYICDRCDSSGVIDFCPELASVQIGGKFSDESLKEFGERVKKLASGKWQIVKFLMFQYGTVDANCPAHKPVIRMIQANGLKYPINNLSNRVSNTLKEKEKDKNKEKEGESEGDWLNGLAKDSAFQGVDVFREHAKMIRWCSENKQQPTRRRFINWLNRADKRMDGSTTKPKLPAPVYPKLSEKREPTDEELEKAKQIAQDHVAKLREQFKFPA